MARFKKGETGNPNGRPKKPVFTFDAGTIDKAYEALNAALEGGESWAVQLVFDRIAPKAKSVTPRDSLDGELLEIKIKELTEFEQRLLALEAVTNEK